MVAVGSVRAVHAVGLCVVAHSDVGGQLLGFVVIAMVYDKNINTLKVDRPAGQFLANPSMPAWVRRACR